MHGPCTARGRGRLGPLRPPARTDGPAGRQRPRRLYRIIHIHIYKYLFLYSMLSIPVRLIAAVFDGRRAAAAEEDAPLAPAALPLQRR